MILYVGLLSVFYGFYSSLLSADILPVSTHAHLPLIRQIFKPVCQHKVQEFSPVIFIRQFLVVLCMKPFRSSRSQNRLRRPQFPGQHQPVQQAICNRALRLTGFLRNPSQGI